MFCAWELTWLLKSERSLWATSMPTTVEQIARIRNATSATAVASRSRIGSRESGVRRRVSGAEDIAGAANRVQQPRLLASLEFAAQVGDEDLDRVRRRERVVAPD